MTHTPAPWQFVPLMEGGVPANDGLGYVRPLYQDGFEICHAGDTGRSGDENRANGVLMAAAPDLLAGCKAAVSAWDKWFQSLPHTAEDEEFREMQIARAAIKKAEG